MLPTVPPLDTSLTEALPALTAVVDAYRAEIRAEARRSRPATDPRELFGFGDSARIAELNQAAKALEAALEASELETLSKYREAVESARRHVAGSRRAAKRRAIERDALEPEARAAWEALHPRISAELERIAEAVGSEPETPSQPTDNAGNGAHKKGSSWRHSQTSPR